MGSHTTPFIFTYFYIIIKINDCRIKKKIYVKRTFLVIRFILQTISVLYITIYNLTGSLRIYIFQSYNSKRKNNSTSIITGNISELYDKRDTFRLSRVCILHLDSNISSIFYHASVVSEIFRFFLRPTKTYFKHKYFFNIVELSSAENTETRK